MAKVEIAHYEHFLLLSHCFQMSSTGDVSAFSWTNLSDRSHSNSLKDQDKFDAGFFGVPPKQANVMDPQLRKLLEGTYESIIDAGIVKQNTKQVVFRIYKILVYSI